MRSAVFCTSRITSAVSTSSVTIAICATLSANHAGVAARSTARGYSRPAMGKLRDLLRRRSGPVAIVLSGGGNHGAVQVGMLRSLVEHDIRPQLVLGLLDRRAQRRRLRAGPDASPASPGSRSCGAASTPRGSCPSGWLPNAVALARKGEAIHGNDRLRGLVTGLLRVDTLRGAGHPVPVRRHRRRRRARGVVLQRAAGRADPGVGRPARRAARGGDRRRPLPRRRHRQRRADQPGRRPRRPHDLRPALRHRRPAPPGAEAAARRRGAGVLDRAPPPVQARPRDAARRGGGDRAAHRRRAAPCASTTSRRAAR